MKPLFCLLVCFFSFLSMKVYADDENAIVICDNGLEMFAWDLEFIRHAQHSVDIAACFFGGEVARELLNEVEARLEVCPDLRVNILATPILLEKEDYAMIDHLRKKYPDNFHLEHASNVTVVWPDVTGLDNHVKMLVVDEQYFSMGGTNLDESGVSEGTFKPERGNNKLNFIASSLPAGMRDQDIVGRGPIAKQLRQTFCKLFAIWCHYNKTGRLEKNPEAFADNSFYFEIVDKPFVPLFEISDQWFAVETSRLKYILSGPHQKNNAITEEYVRLINQAKREIRIANLYFCPADPIFNALLNAVNRGVKLTVITNGISDVSPEYTKYFCWANRLSYVPMLFGKTYHFWDYFSVKNKAPNTTKIFEYHVKDVLLHKKMMIVDEDIFVLGSYNLGVKSHLADYETVMVIHSKEAVKAISKVYSRDLMHSKEVSTKEAIEWYFNPAYAYYGELQKRFHGLI